jgi:hypothetical protein
MPPLNHNPRRSARTVSKGLAQNKGAGKRSTANANDDNGGAGSKKSKRVSPQESSPESSQGHEEDSDSDDEERFGSQQSNTNSVSTNNHQKPSPRTNASPGTMNSILFPQSQNHVSPYDHQSPTDSHQQAVIELDQAAKKAKTKWETNDLTMQARSRACKVIWTICKIPKFTAEGDGTTEKFIKEYMRSELQLPPKDFANNWALIKSAIVDALRTKRASIVQDMKRRFLGKLHCTILLRFPLTAFLTFCTLAPM